MKQKYFIKQFKFHDSNEMDNEFEKILNKMSKEENCKIVQIISKREAQMGVIDTKTMDCYFPWYVSCLFERMDLYAVGSAAQLIERCRLYYELLK